MDKKDIVRMAQEAGFERVIDINKNTGIKTIEAYADDSLERFAKLVAKAKLEEVATALELGPVNDTAASIAIWIREQ